jgi:inosose dehydratase
MAEPSRIRVGNAPCSWGSLEFEGLEGETVGYTQMLDELVETGYRGTELGDWGFMPTEPGELGRALVGRGVTLLGAFVPVALSQADAHDEGVERAVRTARLISKAASPHRPFLVLADDNGTDPVRTRLAGRIDPSMGLEPDEWRIFAYGADRVARAVFDETGLRTVFHHHCAGFVETPDEIEQLLSLTHPERLGLVFDTGHFAFGGGGCGDLTAALDRFAERIWYLHFKDYNPAVGQAARTYGWDYFESVRNGVFCELGQGCVDFGAVKAWLDRREYDGWIVVEQDVLPGMGQPRESAHRNRAFLRRLGL